MKLVCKFKLGKLLPLLLLAKGAGQKTVRLVKDEGCYLMARTDTDKKVIYAKGMTPKDPWIGGDDFSDQIELAPLIRNYKNGFTDLEFTVTDKQISVECSMACGGLS